MSVLRGVFGLTGGGLRIGQLGVLAAALLLSSQRPASAEAPSTEASAPAAVDLSRPTHKQLRVIEPQSSVKTPGSRQLNTFCMDKSGNLLCCMAASTLLVYSPEGELLQEWKLPFTATAINVDRGGSIYVAGGGKVAQLDATGAVLKQAATPNIGDEETFRKEALAAAEREQAEFTQTFDKQLETLQANIEKIEKIEEGERTAAQKARLKAFQQQKETIAEQQQIVKSQLQMDPADVMSRAAAVTGLAITDKHLFICTRATVGYSYEVWRSNLDFTEPKRVLKDLSGCCGQLDIQSDGERLLVAENSKFRVSICDESGKSLNSFGSRDRNAPDGFGSCCNPMNVRCCDGAILCAESSIGTIKKFSPTGEFLGTVGKAKISGGCKHVAIAHDAERDRYYMMNIDKGHICVLVPLSEAPEFTEDELAARAAREGLGGKLVGDWTIPGQQVAKKKRSGLAALFSTLSGGDSTEAKVTSISFSADGSLKCSGGQLESYGEELTWIPSRQDGSTLYVDLEMSGVPFYNFKIVFDGDDKIAVTQRYDEHAYWTETYHRRPCESTETPKQ